MGKGQTALTAHRPAAATSDSHQHLQQEEEAMMKPTGRECPGNCFSIEEHNAYVAGLIDDVGGGWSAKDPASYNAHLRALLHEHELNAHVVDTAVQMRKLLDLYGPANAVIQRNLRKNDPWYVKLRRWLST